MQLSEQLLLGSAAGAAATAAAVDGGGSTSCCGPARAMRAPPMMTGATAATRSTQGTTTASQGRRVCSLEAPLWPSPIVAAACKARDRLVLPGPRRKPRRRVCGTCTFKKGLAAAVPAERRPQRDPQLPRKLVLRRKHPQAHDSEPWLQSCSALRADGRPEAHPSTTGHGGRELEGTAALGCPCEAVHPDTDTTATSKAQLQRKKNAALFAGRTAQPCRHAGRDAAAVLCSHCWIASPTSCASLAASCCPQADPQGTSSSAWQGYCQWVPQSSAGSSVPSMLHVTRECPWQQQPHAGAEPRPAPQSAGLERSSVAAQVVHADATRCLPVPLGWRLGRGTWHRAGERSRTLPQGDTPQASPGAAPQLWYRTSGLATMWHVAWKAASCSLGRRGVGRLGEAGAHRSEKARGHPTPAPTAPRACAPTAAQLPPASVGAWVAAAAGRRGRPSASTAAALQWPAPVLSGASCLQSCWVLLSVHAACAPLGCLHRHPPLLLLDHPLLLS